jgi:cytochrome oxidase Cu insertion factor (SCO1/SenC/PrrC family)
MEPALSRWVRQRRIHSGRNLRRNGMIEAGQPAPDFTLSDQHGETVTLSKLKGEPVVQPGVSSFG